MPGGARNMGRTRNATGILLAAAMLAADSRLCSMSCTESKGPGSPAQQGGEYHPWGTRLIRRHSPALMRLSCLV